MQDRDHRAGIAEDRALGSSHALRALTQLRVDWLILAGCGDPGKLRPELNRTTAFVGAARRNTLLGLIVPP